MLGTFQRLNTFGLQRLNGMGLGLGVSKNNFFASNGAGGIARFRVKDNSAFIVKGS